MVYAIHIPMKKKDSQSSEPSKKQSDVHTLKDNLLRHLEEIAFFLEYNQENPFKIRAYQKGLETLETVTAEDIKKRIENNTLTELEGFGKGLTSVATSFLKLQTSEEWKAAKGDIPVSLVDLRSIRGLGVKKIKTLYEDLGIKTPGELEYACKENRLVGLEGFGEKTQAKILKEVDLLKNRAGKTLLVEKLKEAALIEKKWGKEIPLIQAGQLARKLEIVDHLDYLVVGRVPQVLKTLESKTSPVVFHEASKETLAVQSVFLSSSEEHWKSLQKFAAQKKLELTETALIKNKKPLSLISEQTLYEALELPFYPPECREYPAENKPLRLCEEKDLTGVFHFHTTYSDGTHSLEEMVSAASNHGWQYIGLSDHSQTAFYAQGLTETSLEKQWKEIDAVEKKSSLKIFKGIESDILKNGDLDYPPSVLKRFDFVIASIHSRYGMTDMTERIVKAIENPFTTMIGHLSGRLLLAREAYDLDMKKIIDAAIANKKIIELNAHPQRLDIDWRYLRDACRRGLLISINPDAHSVSGFDDVTFGVWMARKGLVDPKNIFNTWPLEKISAYLSQTK